MTRSQWVQILVVAAIVAIPTGACGGVVVSAFIGGGNAAVYGMMFVAFLLGIGVAKRKVEEQEIHEHTLNEVRGRR